MADRELFEALVKPVTEVIPLEEVRRLLCNDAGS